MMDLARSRRGASSGKSAFVGAQYFLAWVEGLWPVSYGDFFITVGSNQHHDACQSGKIFYNGLIGLMSQTDFLGQILHAVVWVRDRFGLADSGSFADLWL